ncbi:MAG: DUF2723 domain-containing protein [Bacteroidales bacterium]|nr:DUF2723 domain-containing protein [Bacteroidales bacterium]
MKIYNRLNSLIGWGVFLIATVVYLITSEPTMSFWDCGEYIATAYKLEVGHPPGAPLFQMLGRFFSLFAMGDVTQVAQMVNTMSALSSSFTILFLFWSITMIAKKIALRNGEEINNARMYAIMGAGLVGSLAYAFSDSFWFSAVESEVYAMSSFFTAVVFWAILKWEEHADEGHSYRWLILIAYLMGLSIGVHLLNLLAIPAITLVYYFKKYKNPNWKGITLAFGVSIVILAVVMYIIVPLIVRLAGWFEFFFVNTLGLPFNIGPIVYFLLLIGAIVLALIYTRRQARPILNAIVLSLTFILIGYSSFFLLVIRSNADPPIDENNPENAMYLLSYLNREQYGDWPLLKGQYYNAPVVDREDGSPIYAKDEKSGKYVVVDERKGAIPVYDERFTTIFPRMWANMETRYGEGYEQWGQIRGVPIQVTEGDQKKTLARPTFSENLTFFLKYQVIHMYYRYFMWNFAGRQNDIQGLGNKINGNWKSGIPFIDRWRLGPQDKPESMQSNADNSFYFLPLILGLIGIWFTIRKDYKSAVVIALLFLMTGLAIVFYLNQYAPQPRERDYAYAASFYAFAIWMGLGVMALFEWISKKLNAKVTAIAVTLVTLILVPGIMAQQGWNDHDRSGRSTALAIAINYLNSCEPNAILFANGDNDTFPLWYAQEVEGIRTDVRVVNLSLLNTEWYIDQMKRKAYDSDPVPFSLTRNKYRTGNRDVTYLMDDPSLKGMYVNVKDIFDIIDRNEDRLKMNTQVGKVDYFPTKKFMVTYDSAAMVQNGLIPATLADRMDTIRWSINRPAIEKNNLMILDLLATNNWERPVYFVMTTGPSTYLGLDPWFFMEGLTYRLLPAKAARSADGQTGEVNTDLMYDHVVNKFEWGNMEKPGVYIDDNNARMVMNLRNLMSRLAMALVSEGKLDSAKVVMDISLEKMPDAKVPFDYFVLPMAKGYFAAGDTATGMEILERISKYKTEELAYYFSFPDADLPSMDMNIQEALFTVNKLAEASRELGVTGIADTAETTLNEYYDQYMKKVYRP